MACIDDLSVVEASAARGASPHQQVLAGFQAYFRFVGERTAVFLAEYFGGMEAIESAALEQLQQAEEVGPKVAESIFEFFREPQNRESSRTRAPSMAPSMPGIS